MGNKKTLSLPVEGMTCASCVLRVEKALKKIEGVEDVNVNLATEKVTFTFNNSEVDLNKIANAVEDAGYKIILPSKSNADEISGSNYENESIKKYSELKNSFIFSLILTIPVMIVNMVSMTNWFMKWSPLSMDSINRILFLLTTLIIFIPGRRFFISAWKLLKHFSADMNTLSTSSNTPNIAEPPPTHGVNRDSGTASANGGWLRRHVVVISLCRECGSW